MMSPTLILLAALGGVLTVLSPCILPILPPLLGASVAGTQRHRPLWIVSGLALSFTFFGALFAVFGGLLGLSPETLRRAALAVLLFMGLSLVLPGLWQNAGNALARLAAKIPGANALPQNQGLPGALLVGASLGLAWAPCAGPILGIILTLSAVQSSHMQGFLLMGAYSLGAAIPMLLIGYGGRKIAQRLRGLAAWGELSHKALGLLTVATVIALFFHLDTFVLARLPRGFFFAEKLEKKLGAAIPGNALASAAVPAAPEADMPEFAGISAWLNSEPLAAKDLRGKVVLIDFWTYSCINCIRTLPALAAWHDKYKNDGLAIVGVHTPEFKFEADTDNVRKAVARHGIAYPVALDNAYATWNAYSNHYWPAKYLFDAQGRLRKTHFGEGDEEEFEAAIQQLLREAGLSEKTPGISRRDPGVDFSKIHSPETYIGYARSENFISAEGALRDAPRSYTANLPLGPNQWDLEGRWKILAESARLDSPAGKIRYRFHAPQLNLVMQGGGNGVRASVWLDGKPLPAAFRGADVDEDGGVTIRDAKLYNLVKLPQDDEGGHVFELRFETTGVEIYAFTFG